MGAPGNDKVNKDGAAALARAQSAPKMKHCQRAGAVGEECGVY
jgi:hypothetical protein